MGLDIVCILVSLWHNWVLHLLLSLLDLLYLLLGLRSALGFWWSLDTLRGLAVMSDSRTSMLGRGASAVGASFTSPILPFFSNCIHGPQSRHKFDPFTIGDKEQQDGQERGLGHRGPNSGLKGRRRCGKH